MATYSGVCRSSWFRVKDVEAFKKDIEDLRPEMEVWENGDKVAFGGYYVLPFYKVVIQGGVEVEEEIDIAKWVQSRLAPGETAVVCEIGHEGLQYVGGFQYRITQEGIEYTQIGVEYSEDIPL